MHHSRGLELGTWSLKLGSTEEVGASMKRFRAQPLNEWFIALDPGVRAGPFWNNQSIWVVSGVKLQGRNLMDEIHSLVRLDWNLASECKSGPGLWKRTQQGYQCQGAR